MPKYKVSNKMDWYEEEVWEREQWLKEGKIPTGVNLFYGSSSFRLWDTLQEDLQGYKVANLAFGGSTLEACVHFFDRLVIPAQPSSLILYAGDNDLGDGKSVVRVCTLLEAFLFKMDQHFPNLPFSFLSIKPSPAREYLNWHIREVNRYAQEQLALREHSYFIDIYSEMLDNRGKPHPSLFEEDGLHMNTNGYVLWKKILLENARDILV